MDSDDIRSSACTKSALLPEKIQQVLKILLEVRELKLHEATDLNIWEASTFTILHTHVSMSSVRSGYRVSAHLTTRYGSFSLTPTIITCKIMAKAIHLLDFFLIHLRANYVQH